MSTDFSPTLRPLEPGHRVLHLALAPGAVRVVHALRSERAGFARHVALALVRAVDVGLAAARAAQALVALAAHAGVLDGALRVVATLLALAVHAVIFFRSSQLLEVKLQSATIENPISTIDRSPPIILKYSSITSFPKMVMKLVLWLIGCAGG